MFQGIQSGPVYARQGNPTGAALEAKVTLLEDGKGTASFATGMAAIRRVPGVAARGRPRRLHALPVRQHQQPDADAAGPRHGVTFVDATDAAEVRAAITPATRIVFVETIANPVTQVADLDGIGRLCQAAGLLYVVDDTLTTPLLFKAATSAPASWCTR